MLPCSDFWYVGSSCLRTGFLRRFTMVGFVLVLRMLGDACWGLFFWYDILGV